MDGGIAGGRISAGCLCDDWGRKVELTTPDLSYKRSLSYQFLGVLSAGVIPTFSSAAVLRPSSAVTPSAFHTPCGPLAASILVQSATSDCESSCIKVTVPKKACLGAGTRSGFCLPSRLTGCGTCHGRSRWWTYWDYREEGGGDTLRGTVQGREKIIERLGNREDGRSPQHGGRCGSIWGK